MTRVPPWRSPVSTTGDETFALLSPDDGGTCQPLTTSATSASDGGPPLTLVFLVPGNGIDGTVTEILFTTSTGTSSTIAIADIDGDGSLASTFVVEGLPQGTASIGRPVRTPDGAIVVPLAIGTPVTQVSLLRLVHDARP